MVVLCIVLGLPYWLGILITLVAMLLFGALFNLAFYYPLRNRGFQAVIISTIGASMLLENGVLAAYGPQPQSLPGLFSAQGFSIGPIFFDSQYLLILCVTVVMVTLQYLFFERTFKDEREFSQHGSGSATTPKNNALSAQSRDNHFLQCRQSRM